MNGVLGLALAAQFGDFLIFLGTLPSQVAPYAEEQARRWES